MQPWAEQLAAAARYPNVYAKVSGLNTAADPQLVRRRPQALYRSGHHPLSGPIA